MNEYTITDIQLFTHEYKYQIDEDGNYETDYGYSANLIINDSFVVQVSGMNHATGEAVSTFDGVTSSDVAYWKSEETQEKACETIDDNDLEVALEVQGFENNLGWLEDNATDIM